MAIDDLKDTVNNFDEKLSSSMNQFDNEKDDFSKIEKATSVVEMIMDSNLKIRDKIEDVMVKSFERQIELQNKLQNSFSNQQ